MRILNVEPLRYDMDLRGRLASLGRVDYRECETQHDLERALASADYEALFVRLGLAVTARTLETAPSLRFVATPTTGLDHLDLDACAARAVAVLSLRGEEALLRTVRSTAEHTWGLLLALCRRIPWAHADVLAGHWRREPFLAEELSGKTLGIVGLGRLGRMVAGYGLAFGMQVIANDVREDAFAEAPPTVRRVTLVDLLPASDVVSLHVPLDESTTGLIGPLQLGSMRREAVLVNTSRGEVIDEAALAQALALEKLGGAALDVLAGDSRWPASGPPRSSLVDLARSCNRLLITPHVGGYGRASLARTRCHLVETLRAALEDTHAI